MLEVFFLSVNLYQKKKKEQKKTRKKRKNPSAENTDWEPKISSEATQLSQ